MENHGNFQPFWRCISWWFSSIAMLVKCDIEKRNTCQRWFNQSDLYWDGQLRDLSRRIVCDLQLGDKKVTAWITWCAMLFQHVLYIDPWFHGRLGPPRGVYTGSRHATIFKMVNVLLEDDKATPTNRSWWNSEFPSGLKNGGFPQDFQGKNENSSRQPS